MKRFIFSRYLLIALCVAQILEIRSFSGFSCFFLSPRSQTLTLNFLHPIDQESVGRFEFLMETDPQTLKYREYEDDRTHYKKLGAGASGKIYAAIDKKTGKKVALKIFKDAYPFYRELCPALRFNHPNVARPLDYGLIEIIYPDFPPDEQKEKKHFIAWELAETDFDSLIPRSFFSIDHKNHIPLTLQEKLTLFLQVLEGLEHIHSRGMVHGDLKPENILIAGEGKEKRALIIDFGIAYEENKDMLGFCAGTFSYISPEMQKRTVRCADPRSDIYSMGAILYFAMTGRAPFEGREIEISSRPVIPKFKERIPLLIWSFIKKAMDPDPALRFPSARAFREDLEKALAEETSQERHEDATAKWRKKFKETPNDLKNLFFYCFALHAQGVIDASEELVQYLQNNPLSLSEKELLVRMSLQFHVRPLLRHPKLLEAIGSNVIHGECLRVLKTGPDIAKEKAVLLLGGLHELSLPGGFINTTGDLFQVVQNPQAPWWVRQTAILEWIKTNDREKDRLKSMHQLSESTTDDGLVVQTAKDALRQQPSPKTPPIDGDFLPISSRYHQFEIDPPFSNLPEQAFWSEEALVEECLKSNIQTNCFAAAAALIRKRAFAPLMEVVKGSRPTKNLAPYELAEIERGERSNNWNRIPILLHLVKTKNPDAIPILLEVAANKKYTLEGRLTAIRAIGKMGHLNLTDDLLLLLRQCAYEEDPNIQATAKEVLFELFHKTKEVPIKKRILDITFFNPSLFSEDQLAHACFSLGLAEIHPPASPQTQAALPFEISI